MNRIAIIDGNSLINRAYYAMRNPMITKEGIFTQGIFGFINMMEKIKKVSFSVNGNNVILK